MDQWKMEIDDNEDANPPPFPLILSAFGVLAIDEELQEQEAQESFAQGNKTRLSGSKMHKSKGTTGSIR